MCCVLKHNIALACRSSVGWFLTLLNNSVKQLFSCVVNSSASFLWAKIHFENKCSNILSNWYIQVRIFARKKKEWMLAGSIYFNIWKTFRLTAHHHLWLALSGNILNQTHSNFFLQTEFILIVFFLAAINIWFSFRFTSFLFYNSMCQKELCQALIFNSLKPLLCWSNGTPFRKRIMCDV